jgi:hypothetical protein
MFFKYGSDVLLGSFRTEVAHKNVVHPSFPFSPWRGMGGWFRLSRLVWRAPAIQPGEIAPVSSALKHRPT